MDWREHMAENATNWLTGRVPDLELDPDFLMLFGNPYLFQDGEFASVVGETQEAGVFRRGTFDGKRFCCCPPLFGAPFVAMYVEVLARLGVRRIIACGYVGGINSAMAIGSYVVPSLAFGFDGCTRAYLSEARDCPASSRLVEALRSRLKSLNFSYETGRIASIDALMLEDDDLIARLSNDRFACLDLETACLYALGERLGLDTCAIHIVSDNPSNRQIDREKHHEASFADQIRIALDVLTGFE